MKKTIVLFLLFSSFVQAQITTVEYDNQLKLISGNDFQLAQSNQNKLDIKYPNDAKVMCLRGLFQFRDSNTNGALMSFSAAIKINPNYVYAYVCRAQVFMQKELKDKAIEDLSKALQIEPKNTDLLHMRLGIYYQNQKYALALEDCKTLIQLEPNEIANYFDAANCALAIDEKTNTTVFFDQAYANKNIPKYKTDLKFGEFLFSNTQFDKAKVKYEIALSSNEINFSGEDFNNLAIIYYKLKDYDKSIIFSKKAIHTYPNNINFYLNLASTYIDLKNWSKVKETAQIALNINSANIMANMYMAIGLKYTGNETESKFYESKAKQLEINNNQ